MVKFYTNLITWPSRWRDYCCSQSPKLANIAANAPDWHARRRERWDLTLNNPEMQAKVRSDLSTLEAVTTCLVANIR